jgi:hypothetical protein
VLPVTVDSAAALSSTLMFNHNYQSPLCLPQ